MVYKYHKQREIWRRNRRARIFNVGGLDFTYAKLEIAKEKYGITKETFEHLLQDQNRSCAICKRLFMTAKEICVDHNHKTGEIRGLLCFHCNTALGHVFENQDILTRMKVYLEVWH